MFTSIGQPVEVWPGSLSSPHSSPSTSPVLEVGADLDALFGKYDLASSTSRSTIKNNCLRKSLVWTIRNNTEIRLRRQLQRKLEHLHRLQYELFFAVIGFIIQQHTEAMLEQYQQVYWFEV